LEHPRGQDAAKTGESAGNHKDARRNSWNIDTGADRGARFSTGGRDMAKKAKKTAKAATKKVAKKISKKKK
jgi:hypothetical protein